jgi:Rrf2 family protein
VVVRRIVGALRNAGMVSVQPGVGGGATLAREPHDITLLDVYRAVEERDELFTLPAAAPARDCSVGGHIVDVLRPIFCQAHKAMEGVLGEVTIADVGEQVMSRAHSAGGCCESAAAALDGVLREQVRG